MNFSVYQRVTSAHTNLLSTNHPQRIIHKILKLSLSFGITVASWSFHAKTIYHILEKNKRSKHFFFSFFTLPTVWHCWKNLVRSSNFWSRRRRLCVWIIFISNSVLVMFYPILKIIYAKSHMHYCCFHWVIVVSPVNPFVNSSFTTINIVIQISSRSVEVSKRKGNSISSIAASKYSIIKLTLNGLFLKVKQ